ncbi:MAG: diguanylate cyclase [Desulfoprunum sp.]|nr:diguanylate cyclase [Desulfoprunum sp.]
MLNRLTVREKMYLIIAMTLVMFMVNAQFAWVNINKIKDIGLKKTEESISISHRAQIKVATDTLAATLATTLKSVTSTAEQERMLQAMLKDVRFEEDKSGYFFVFKDTVNIVTGPKPELQGKDLSQMKDANGIFVVRGLFELAQKGGGFLEYLWPKPGKGDTPKISYATMIPGTAYWIGTGVYTDASETYLANLRQDLKSITESRSYFMLFTVGAIFIGLTLLSLYIISGIIKALRSLIGSFQDIAHGEGQTALTKRIAITSIDEIGMLSTEFNSLMESINNLSVFKKVIEEDDSLEEVYQRIGEVFTQQLGISRCFIYQIVNAKNAMHMTYPSSFDQEEMLCNHAILDDNDLCKAKRTGHIITSTIFPEICRQFTGQEGWVHYCLPIVVGGATVAVVQFVFDTPDTPSDKKAIEAKVYKAEQYINESLAVIETKRLMSSLKDSALIDPLTGLNNRRYLQEYTEKIVAGVLRRGKSIGLIMCDLDYFKQVNDTYGHNAGDLVLKETSKVIRQSIRESDIVIRFGGEEFLAVLLDINEGESMNIAEKIRVNIEQLKIKIPDGVIQKTISLGTSEFPADTGTLWSCIKFADVALYRAKAEGRNRCVRFTKDMWKEEQV